ncbi:MULTISPECIES: hypothetical protein [unclassified Myroides]|uniref:hypothetical protein n=1 Tax=unclassified Myroides TaxID=2642485 RepID=UPI003D2F9A3B
MRESKAKKGRMCVYANDVIRITGRSYKTALKILIEIRTFYDKPQGALVTYKEFSSYMNLDEDDVYGLLQ